MKSFIIALQLQDCAMVVQSWTRPAFPIENVRKIINPSPIDQSRLQWDYKRMSNPATIHWIGNQILGTCFFFNPDRIGPIIWQSTKNVAIRLQFQINPNLTAHRQVLGLESIALFDMPNLNRFDILSISIFCKIALSISISISIFSKITISISISISIFLELPYRYRYRYRYFSELPYRYRYRYRYFQLLHIDIDIDIDIFQKCRYIDNRYFLSIF